MLTGEIIWANSIKELRHLTKISVSSIHKIGKDKHPKNT